MMERFGRTGIQPEGVLAPSRYAMKTKTLNPKLASFGRIAEWIRFHQFSSVANDFVLAPASFCRKPGS
jgi:hypothetical protein